MFYNNFVYYLSKTNVMLEPEQVPIMVKILKDYLGYKGKKQFVNEATKLLKDLEEERARKREENRKKSIKIMKKDLAKEFGIDQQTMMSKINRDDVLCDELSLAGYRKKEKGYYPIEAKIIRKFFSGEDYEIISKKESK